MFGVSEAFIQKTILEKKISPWIRQILKSFLQQVTEMSKIFLESYIIDVTEKFFAFDPSSHISKQFSKLTWKTRKNATHDQTWTLNSLSQKNQRIFCPKNAH